MNPISSKDSNSSWAQAAVMQRALDSSCPQFCTCVPASRSEAAQPNALLSHLPGDDSVHTKENKLIVHIISIKQYVQFM